MHSKNITSVIIILAFCLTCFSCNKGSDTQIIPPAIVPVISIQDVNQPITATNTTLQFYLICDKASPNAVSVEYSLTDGTAKSPKDYVAASGTVTIPANQTNTTFDVQIKGDPSNLRQPNLQFSAQLSKTKLCTIANASSKGT